MFDETIDKVMDRAGITLNTTIDSAFVKSEAMLDRQISKIEKKITRLLIIGGLIVLLAVGIICYTLVVLK